MTTGALFRARSKSMREAKLKEDGDIREDSKDHTFAAYSHSAASYLPRALQPTSGTLARLQATFFPRGRANLVRITIAVATFLFFSSFLFRSHSTLDDPVFEVGTETEPDNVDWNQAANKHPIQLLAEDAEEGFARMVESQSTTLEQAVERYQDKYGRSPPPKFDVWFKLAQEHNFLLVDEFDTVMKTLEPFWGVHPTTLRERLNRTQGWPYLVHSTLNQTGYFSKVSDSPGGNRFYDAVFDGWWHDFPQFKELISSVDYVYNYLDEPRISVPYEDLQESLLLAESQIPNADGVATELERTASDVGWHNFGHESTWEFLLDACRTTDPARLRAGTSIGWNTSRRFEEVEFLDPQGLIESKSPCMNAKLHHHHSLYISPLTLDLSKRLIPIFSQARSPIFNDILFPSPWYSRELDGDKPDVPEGVDIPFAERKNQVYWVGSADCGWPTLDNWRRINRQWLAQLVMPSNKPVTLMSKEEPGTEGIWATRTENAPTWRDMASYFHVRISEVFFGPGEVWDAQVGVLKPEREPMEESYKSKYCLDIDGTTYSGRFYRLLRSNCTVFKQTVFEEWHDSWLVPWVHYVPISPRAAELPEAARFFIDEPEGVELGEKIAKRSSEWARRVLRKVDFQLYFLRTLLEYDRIMTPGREKLYYQG